MARTGSVPSLFYPLDRASALRGGAARGAGGGAPGRVPAPYRRLLVHEQDMTWTLEQHHGGPVLLRTLSTFTRGHWYARRVLLVQASTGRPVEMGAIRIRLDAFRPAIRRLILRNEIPLGRLLRTGGVDFTSRPRAFMAVTPNSEMMGVFWMPKPRTLYGRQTELSAGGRLIGNIVEILPPA